MITPKKGNFFETAAIYSVILACFVLPLATSLLSLFSILTLFFWLFSGKWHTTFKLFKTNPIVLFSVLLFTMFLIGLLYTSAETIEALSYLKKYRELLFVPVLASLLKDDGRAQKNCEYSFLFGCIILMFVSYGMYFSIVPTAKFGYSLIHHITHSYFMAILAFWSLQKAADFKQYRYFWAVIFLLSVVNLFYIAPGRTGMLVFVLLMLLFLVQRLSLLYLAIGTISLAILLAITFATSDNFANRSRAAIGEIQKYEYGDARTSLGMRFDWWIDSARLILEKPVAGHGTGSFTKEHGRFIAETKIKSTDNPHNEYLLIGVQLGTMGLGLYLLLLGAQVICSRQLNKHERYLAQGIAVAMAAGCLANSFLFDTHQGHLWAFLTGVYFAAYPDSSANLTSI